MRTFMTSMVLVAVLALCCAGALAAPITAAVYNGGGAVQNFDRATGYQFEPTVDITVSALGVYDHSGPGFTDPHDVGIFEMDGTAVATASLLAGTSGVLIDGTRFTPITPVELVGGTEYYILADNFLDDAFAFGSGGVVTYAAEITWHGFTDSVSNSIFDDVNHFAGLPGNLGPNFRYRVRLIPEPATLGLLGLGLAAVARRRRR